MNSKTAAQFRKDFERLPKEIQALAREVYRAWRQDPWQSSLQFKQIHQNKPYYSVRIGAHWRAVGLKTDNTLLWFWIGSHAEYDRLIDNF